MPTDTAPAWDEHVTLATVEKNASEQIRITRGEIAGRDCIGLRIWWRRDADDEWKPSRKGLTVRADLAPAIVEGLRKALESGAA